MKKVLVDLTVKEVQSVNANWVLLVMGCDKPLPDTYPGQFAELRIDNTPTVMLRRPISVHSFDAERNEVGFLVQLVGDGTRWLGSLKVGDKIKLFSREYQIVSFGGDVKSPEVKVADGLTKKESVITNAGKKQ
jgi:dihydroorotate dehydrogenase electron transfer subunit